MIPLRIMETCDTLVGNVKEDNKNKCTLSNRQGKTRVDDSIASNNTIKYIKDSNTTTNSVKQTVSLSVKEAAVETSLDDVPVEACLEYLTRPHTSWRSVVKLHEQRKARITNHSLSVYSRSKAATRRSSFASQLSFDTSNATTNRSKSGKCKNNNNVDDLLWNSFASFQSINSVNGSEFDIKNQSDRVSCASSVCTAPVQINSSYNSNNKSNKGRLCRGRRMILPTSSSNNNLTTSATSSFCTYTSAVLSVNGAKLTNTSMPLESSSNLTVTGLTACNSKLQNRSSQKYHLHDGKDNINPSVNNSVHENDHKSNVSENKTSRWSTNGKQQQKHINSKNNNSSSKPQLQKPGVLRSSSYLPPLPPSRLQTPS